MSEALVVHEEGLTSLEPYFSLVSSMSTRAHIRRVDRDDANRAVFGCRFWRLDRSSRAALRRVSLVLPMYFEGRLFSHRKRHVPANRRKSELHWKPK